MRLSSIKGETMKLKSLLFAVCFGLAGHAVAANQHLHPKANEVNNKNTISKPSMLPRACEIEIINDSYTDVNVFGTFDDGAPLSPFTVYRFDAPHYISLYYYGYCHNGMVVGIENARFPYDLIYKAWTNTYSTVRVVPYLAKGLNKSEKDKNVKVEVTTK